MRGFSRVGDFGMSLQRRHVDPTRLRLEAGTPERKFHGISRSMVLLT
jgi:hypothetical protein